MELHVKREEDMKLFNNKLRNIESIIINKSDLCYYANQVKNYSDELYNHSLNVALLSIILGNKVGIKNSDELFVSAFFHDYGKTFIPKDILDKPGPLSNKERTFMQLHPTLGYIQLKNSTTLSHDVLCGILEHHERIDGAGYNTCRKGTDISLYAKIIALADVYDAMTSDRVYRKGIAIDEVRNYLKVHAGKQFDMNLTNIFLETIPQYDRNIQRLKKSCSE